jgi:hypothetical protein
MRLSLQLGLYVFASSFLSIPSIASVAVTPDNANIQYYGRFDKTNPLQPRCEWTGSHIRAAFIGTSIAATLVSDGNVHLDILIDGACVKVDSILTMQRSLVCASGLTKATHELVLYIRSEEGILSFKGLTLDDGASLVSAGVRPARKIEFIGDSYTVGYGNEATDVSICVQQLPPVMAHFTDNYRSWAPRAARACNAEFVEVAKSGWGIVRNCWTPAKSDSTIGTIYKRTFYKNSGGNWNFTSWKPDLVCVGIGTNDFNNCNPSDPRTALSDSATIVSAYRAFLGEIRANYSGVKIICNAPPVRPIVANCVKQVVALERAAGKTDIYYAQWPWDTTKNTICTHPNLVTDSIVGKVIADSIMRIMGWGISVGKMPSVKGWNSQGLTLRRLDRNTLSLRSAEGAALSGPVKVYRINGECVESCNGRILSDGSIVINSPVKGLVMVSAVVNGRRCTSAPMPAY